MEHAPVEPIGIPTFGARTSDAAGGAAGGVQRGGPEDEGVATPPVVPNRTPRTPRVRPQRAQPDQVE